MNWIQVLALLVVGTTANQCVDPREDICEVWGHIKVRRGAHMFYWLSLTTAEVATYADRPLVIWLQGGPAASGTGRGNCVELGLCNRKRFGNSSWMKDFNLLYIDSPVGAGYSYVDQTKLLNKSNKEIAKDLVRFINKFYSEHNEFQNVPLHIFCEDYGCKMAAEFALELYNSKEEKKIKTNLKSVVMGNPWISPIDSIISWAPLLWNMGVVDRKGYKNVRTLTNEVSDLILQEKWIKATETYRDKLIPSILKELDGVAFHNIQKQTKPSDESSLKALMRGEMRKYLSIPENIVWDSQANATYSSLGRDILKPVVDIVNELLANTTLSVGVFSGQLDLMSPTAGTLEWVETLRWKSRKDYVDAARQAIFVNDIFEGYKKSTKRFSMYWINRAGRRLPTDNPAAMSYILKDFTNFG